MDGPWRQRRLAGHSENRTPLKEQESAFNPRFYGIPRGEKEIMKDVGRPVGTLEIPSVSDSDGMEPLCITDVRALASYNWTTDSKPTIVVPGALSQVFAGDFKFKS